VTNQLPVAILSWKTRISTRRLLRRSGQAVDHCGLRDWSQRRWPFVTDRRDLARSVDHRRRFA
jgi:hypothetical protein